MADLNGINPYGSMIDSSNDPNGTLPACSKCDAPLTESFAQLYANGSKPLCLKCIQKNWSRFTNQFRRPIDTPDHIASYDELSRHNSIERQMLKKSPSPSMSGQLSFSTLDLDALYNEARSIKHQADKYRTQRAYRKAAHKYLHSAIRFMFVGTQREDVMNGNVNICNHIMELCLSKLNAEYDLAMLLKAFNYYFLYQSNFDQINPRHAYGAKTLDRQTKQFIDTSFYMMRALQYLKQIEDRYGNSPLHQNFYRLKTEDFLAYVEAELRKLESS